MPNTGDYVKATDFDELKPKLSIGTVNTGAAGTNASASITGATPNFTLNLTIPRGNTGATGPQGPSGVYTGPLKPSNTYWRGAESTGLQGTNRWKVSVPSGGSWVVWCRNASVRLPGSADRFDVNAFARVLAGGTVIQSDITVDVSVAPPGREYLCWRIQ